MTDGPPTADAAATLTALLRRAGHELRNAQSAASVNIEVIRSRAAAGTGDVASMLLFAENAADGLDESVRLAEGMVALCSGVTRSLASGKPLSAVRTESGSEIEIRMPQESVVQLISAVGYLAERIGLGVERTDAGVILKIPPDHETSRA